MTTSAIFMMLFGFIVTWGELHIVFLSP
ncbi:TPA: MetS family NSS transporter small subunit [Photobacterium damselae]